MIDNYVDEQYNSLVRNTINYGTKKKNRTGVDTIGVFGAMAKYDCSETFPILTTKKVFWKGIVHELLWFLSGSSNIKYLIDNGVHIWDGDGYRNYKNSWDGDPVLKTKEDYIKVIKETEDKEPDLADLGTGTYGSMWRSFPHEDNGDGAGSSIDQISKVIKTLKENPDDRRMIVSAWHPYWVDHCALPPCHVMFQFNTELGTDKEGNQIRILNLAMTQRSCDLFLGVPFNISSYCLLLNLVAHCVGMQPGIFTHFMGDLHIYENHLDQIKEQITRSHYPLPTLTLNSNKHNIFDFTFEDIRLNGYQSHPALKADVNVG